MSRTHSFQQIPTDPDDNTLTGRRRGRRDWGGILNVVLNPVLNALETVWKRYQRASRRQKLILWTFVAVNLAILLAIYIVTPTRILQSLQNLSGWLRDQGSFGAFLLFVAIVLSSHPPLFGFASSLTLIGFTFGMWPGALIGIMGSMCGSGLAFWSVRTFFLQWMKRFGAGKSDKWEAFAHVIKAKGTILVIMIRWCPLPWALSNGMFASIETVSFPSFMLANLLLQPRLMIPIFIGSRLESLTESGPADPVGRWINLGAILLGVSISAGTGWFIYRATLQQMEQLRASGDLTDREADDAEDILERNALLADFSGSDSDADELRLGGVLENGHGHGPNVGRSSVRSGHIRQESV